VLEQFIANRGTPHAHWWAQLLSNLLIVDDAHRLMP